jgi:hypothetical protein
VDGWETSQRQTEDGAVESEQSVMLRTPVVDFSVDGAQYLGRAYWREVERVTRRIVRAHEQNGSLELRLLGRGPALLRFGPPQVEATSDLASCSYPIRGGLLASRPAGEIVFAQVGASSPAIRSTVRGFYPRLAAREGEPDWTGALYSQVQSRIHVAVSRRYFARLIAQVQA